MSEKNIPGRVKDNHVKRHHQLASLAVIVMIGGKATFGGAVTDSAEYFVSPTGNDVRRGIAVDPFRTIQQAANVMQPGDTCTILAGVYRETVTLTRSGAVGKPILFRTAAGAEVVLDGTEAIPGEWGLHQGQIFKTKVAAPVAQLFHNGKMMIEARWPNVRFAQLLGREHWAQAVESSHGRIEDPVLARTGVDFTGARATLSVAHQFNTWTRSVTRHGAGQATFEYPADLPGLGGLEHAKSWKGNWYYLSGVLAALDAPGEWYYDATSQTLYLWPLDGQRPAADSVHYKVRDYGWTAKNCGRIILQGIRFFGCTFRFDNCDDCLIDDCHLLFPVATRELSELGNPRQPTPGTLIQGDRNIIRHCSLAFSPTHGLAVNGSHNRIEDCLIHDFCWTGSLFYLGIKIGPKPGFETKIGEAAKSPGGTLVSRCTVFNGGNALVAVYGQPGSVVEYCHIHHGGMACKDVSLLYTGLPTIEPATFRYNWVHDCGTPYGALGIRGDDQTRGLTLHHNVVFHCGWEGMVVKGDRNQVFNNTAFDNGRGPSAPAQGTDLLLFSEPEPEKSWREQWPLLKVQNQNSRTVNNAVERIIGARDSSAVAPGGQLENNFVGDVKAQLVDPAHFDFRPKAGSPLIAGGQEILGITDGFSGRGPDCGAYEHGVEPWKPGVTWSPAELEAHWKRIAQLQW